MTLVAEKRAHETLHHLGRRACRRHNESGTGALEEFTGAVVLVSHDRLMRQRFRGERLDLPG